MGRSKPTHKKKKPITQTTSAKGWGKNGHQKLITKFHALTKQINATNANLSLSEDEKADTVAKLQAEIDACGGLDRYQTASKRGEKLHAGFNTSKWVSAKLVENNLRPSAEPGKKIRLLDVGALNENYAKHRSWIDCTAIDINSQHPFVKEMNFFDVPVQDPLYDVVVLSLVVNFVGDIGQRGEMLQRSHALLRPGGHMFLVLPLPCVENSRYMTEERLIDILEYIGYRLILSHHTPKLVMYMLQANDMRDIPKDTKVFSKEKLRNGDKRNNFTIVLNCNSINLNSTTD